MYFGSVLGLQVCVYFRCFNLPSWRQLARIPNIFVCQYFASVRDEVWASQHFHIFTPVRLNLVRRLSPKLFKCSLLSFFHCSWICTSRWSFNLICNANLSCSYDSRNRSSTSTNTWNLHPIDKVHSPIEGVVLVRRSSNQQIVFLFRRELSMFRRHRMRLRGPSLLVNQHRRLVSFGPFSSFQL